MNHMARVIIPPGLKVLLESLSKAVVRSQPENIPHFASLYYNALLDFKAERPSLDLDDLIKEFKETTGSHFFKKAKPPQLVVPASPIQDREAGRLLMEAKHDHARQPFPFIPETSSQDLQPADPSVPPVDADENKRDLAGMLSATNITMSSEPIPPEIAANLAVFRRKHSTESSPGDNPSGDEEGDSPCNIIHSALFERVSLSEVNQEVDAVMIRTDALPEEDLIMVQTEDVPEIIVFQVDPLMAARGSVTSNEVPSNVFIDSSCCCDMTGGPLDDAPPLEVVGTSQPLHPVVTSSDTSPMVEAPTAIKVESQTLRDEVLLPEDHTPTAPSEPMEMTYSLPVASQEVPASPPTVVDAPAPAVQEVEVVLPPRSRSPTCCLVCPPSPVHGGMKKCSPTQAVEEMRAPEPIPEERESPVLTPSPPPAAREETESFDLVCPSTAATVETVESSNQMCGSSGITEKMEASNMVCPPALAIEETEFTNLIIELTEETESANLVCPPYAVMEETKPTNQICPATEVTEETKPTNLICPAIVDEAPTAIKVESQTLRDEVLLPEDHTPTAPSEPMEMTYSLSVASQEVPASPPTVVDAPAPAVQEVEVVLPPRSRSPACCLVCPPSPVHGGMKKCSPTQAVEEMRAPEPIPEERESPVLTPSPPPAAREETESSDLICPRTAATVETVESSNQMCGSSDITEKMEASNMVCPPALAIEETESTNLITELTESTNLVCPSYAVTEETKPTNLICPATVVTEETKPTNLICPATVVTEETKPTNQICPATVVTEETKSINLVCTPTEITKDIKVPVPVAPVETNYPNVLPPHPTASEETQATATAPAYLVYLPLPAELAKTPSLVCQLGIGQEEAKSFPFVCVPMTPAELPMTSSFGGGTTAQEIPRTPSYVANLAGVQGISRIPSHLANVAGVQEIQRTPSYLANAALYPKMSRTQSFVCPSITASELSRSNSLVYARDTPVMPQEDRGPCLVCRPFTLYPQGVPTLADGAQVPAQHPASLQQQAARTLFNNGLQADFMPQCSHGLGHQRAPDMPMTMAGMEVPSCLCTSLSGSGSHWRLCHLTRPESHGRMGGMLCPYQTMSMAQCGLEHMANIPMYQDCGRCCSCHHQQHQILNSHSSHGSLHTHHMAEPLCTAHSLGSFGQPRLQTCSSDPFFCLPQYYHHMAVSSPSQDRQCQALCPLQCPLLQQRHSSLLMCGHQGELSRNSSSNWLFQGANPQGANPQGRVEQKDSIPSCASLHSKSSETSNPNPGYVMNYNPQGN